MPWRRAATRTGKRIGEIYDVMVGIRQEIATNAGFENYRDYMFRAKRRFEYGPGECES